MPILNLNELRVGDVILEPGKGTIADLDSNGGQGYGHAKLVVCRLAFIHAPRPGGAVMIEPFNVETWTRDSEPPVFGVYVNQTTVMRKPDVVEADVQAEAQWEAGYGYASIAKLKQLGFSPEKQALLDTPIYNKLFERYSKYGVPPNDEGRSCGELVARILLPSTSSNVTPNGLRRHQDLEERPELIQDDAGWSHQGPHSCNNELEDLFSKYRQDTARRLWEDLVRFAATNSGEDEVKAMSKRLETELEADLQNNLSILKQVDSIASRYLPN